MTVRIYGSPYRHRFHESDTDARLGWTVCGIRFAWGRLARAGGLTGCPECFA